MQIIENNIYSWADWDSVDELAKTQVRNTSRLPIVAGRVMLMPDAHGINEVMRWAWSEHGKFLPEAEDCDSGVCGG